LLLKCRHRRINWNRLNDMTMVEKWRFASRYWLSSRKHTCVFVHVTSVLIIQENKTFSGTATSFQSWSLDYLYIDSLQYLLEVFMVWSNNLFHQIQVKELPNNPASVDWFPNPTDGKSQCARRNRKCACVSVLPGFPVHACLFGPYEDGKGGSSSSSLRDPVPVNVIHLFREFGKSI